MTGEFAIAVHAIVYLNHRKMMISSDLLAENICTNPARIRKVMSKLKKAGLVKTKEGLEGGYYFEKNDNQVTLGDISEALDHEIITVSWKSGDKQKKCQVASGMAEVMDYVYKELNSICIKKLESITISQIDRHLFDQHDLSF